MAPPAPSAEAKIINLKTVGGEIGAASSLAPKVGPLGLSPKKIGEDIQKATMEWKGLKVMVRLTVVNRVATVPLISVRRLSWRQIDVIPSAASMIIRELKEAPRVRKAVKKQEYKHYGNLEIDQVISISKLVRGRSMAKVFSGTVKEVLGTVRSVGVTVDGKSPAEIIAGIDDGSIEIPEL